MYVKVKDGEIDQYPYSIDLLKSDNPNTSFPKEMEETTLNEYGVFSVDYQAQPAYDKLTQRVEHSSEPVLIGGKWVTTKTVVELTPEQAEAAKQQSFKQVQDSIVQVTQRKLDDFARTRNYEGILSLCTYATSTNPTFKQEGQCGVELRDATWSKLYSILAEVTSGTREVPSGYSDIENELPLLAWPVEP